ncbi:MAG: DUF3891 family protein [Baekduia sp.]
MILRRDGDAVLAIGQASHAWLSGQLARAWGNARFPVAAPFEEVCLGALQHDIGMAEWDLRPERHPDTGLPRQFFELDRRTHLALWTAAPTRVLSQSRYAALLVSLHGTGLYERFPPNTDDPEIARAVADYLDGQRALQARLAAEVGATPEELARNQALLAIWDGLSLALCRDQAPHVIDGFTLDRAGAVAVPPRGQTPKRKCYERDAFTLDPWPFTSDRLNVRVEGRLLTAAPYPDEPALHAALDRAPVLTVGLDLRPRERRSRG